MKLKIKEYKIDKNRLPTKLILNGVLYSVFVIVLAVSILFIIPIQEKVSGEVEIHTFGIPLELKAKRSGQLFLNVEDNARVEEGQLLGSQIWNITPRTYADIDTLLKAKLNLQYASEIDRLEHLANQLVDAELPEIQGSIGNILSAIEKYRIQLEANDPALVVQSLNSEIEEQRASLPLFDQKRNIIEQKVAILESRLAEERKLLEAGGISQEKVSMREAELADEEALLVTNDLEKKAAEQRSNELLSQISSIENKFKGLQAGFLSEIENARSELNTVYYEVAHDKIIKSPIDGIVTKSPSIISGNEIEEDEIILAVVPDEEVKRPEMNMYIPLRRAGEVNEGQRVFIKLDEYPAREFGEVAGLVLSQSPIPDRDRYRLVLDVDLPLTTIFGSHIERKAYYHGTGDILTRKLTVYDKILEELRFSRSELNRSPVDQ